jgi:hypothetical protein
MQWGSGVHMHVKIAFAVASLMLAFAATAKETPPLTDAQLRKEMIQASIASYPGRCPCPYNSAKNGSACGGRSAYSRPGGYAPLCYPKDISDDMLKKYRQQHP